MCLCQYEDEPGPSDRIAPGSILIPAPYIRTALCARPAPAVPAGHLVPRGAHAIAAPRMNSVNTRKPNHHG